MYSHGTINGLGIWNKSLVFLFETVFIVRDPVKEDIQDGGLFIIQERKRPILLEIISRISKRSSYLTRLTFPLGLMTF